MKDNKLWWQDKALSEINFFTCEMMRVKTLLVEFDILTA